MSDPASDIEVMDVDDSDENVSLSSLIPEKNGISGKNVLTEVINKTNKKNTEEVKILKDDTLNNSNHVLVENATNISSVRMDKDIDEVEDNASDSQESAPNKKPDSKEDELKESNDTNDELSLAENHNKDSDSIVENSKAESETPVEAASPSSAAESDKKLCNDSETTSVAKPSPIPERLLDESPKCSPELIVCDDGPLKKTKGEINDSSDSKAKDDKVNESSKDVLDDNNSEASKGKGPEVETKTKHESKSKKEGESGKKKKGKTCAECGMKKKLQLRIVFQGKAYQLCSEVCYGTFKEKKVVNKPSTPTPATTTDEKCAQCQNKIKCGPGFFPSIGEIKPLCSDECMKKYHEVHAPQKNCGHCKKKIDSIYNQLTWETMVFCNEDCLGKYQSFLGSHCTCCQSPVQQISLGKYCVCFGADIRQFCSGSCLEEFKKGLKVCSFCQTDLSAGSSEGFLAPVGDKGQFKDFCSQQCMERYEGMNNVTKSTSDPKECSHCRKQGSFKTQVKHGAKTYSLCCDICVAGFRCSFSIKDNVCSTCFNFFKPKVDENFNIKFEGSAKIFCTKACMTLFVLSHRKIIQCGQCKVKKYTFDMIEKIEPNNQSQMFCSLNCLSLYRVNLSAASAQSVLCDNCSKSIPAQFHLTMSDGSVRNFCSYQCVLFFQNRFPAGSALTTPTASQKPSTVKAVVKTTSSGTNPIIANVVSLAAPAKPVSSAQGKSAAPQSQTQSDTPKFPALTVATNATGAPIVREIVVRPPVPKSVKNKSASCKPIMQTKGVNARLQTCHKAVQTDERPMPIILPVPIPIYVPTPMHLYARPVPCPVPFAVPIPIPILIQSSNAFQDIQEKASSNSLGADLLKMAEMVAESASKSQKEPDLTVLTPPKTNNVEADKSTTQLSTTTSSIQASIPKSTTQVSANINTIQASANQVNSHNANTTEKTIALKIELADDYIPTEIKPKQRSKRGGGDLKQYNAKKPKLEEVEVNNLKLSGEDLEENKQVEDIMNTHFEDADKKLKYAFGVNAWRQWALGKNGCLDRGTPRKLKSFKTDMLQLCAEDLSFSLSLFVKEIKRPSGEPYTAGALFYLLLGIQLYINDNGRNDDLFSDEHYQVFSESFHEVLDRYESRALTLEVPWSRIKEEFLWDSRQLGAQSPQILLNTLIYFNAKYFKMRTIAPHMNLSFSHISRHTEASGSYLRYYGPYMNGVQDEFKDGVKEVENVAKAGKKGVKAENGVKQKNGLKEENDEDEKKFLFQPENYHNQLRCPVRLFEFYISKCPKKFRGSESSFYRGIIKDCTFNSKIWYSDIPLNQAAVHKKLQRIKFIEEVYET